MRLRKLLINVQLLPGHSGDSLGKLEFQLRLGVPCRSEMPFKCRLKGLSDRETLVMLYYK